MECFDVERRFYWIGRNELSLTHGMHGMAWHGDKIVLKTEHVISRSKMFLFGLFPLRKVSK